MSGKKTVQYADLPKIDKKVCVTRDRMRVTKDGKRSIRTCVKEACPNDMGQTHMIGVLLRNEIDAETDSELKFGLSGDAALVLGEMLIVASDDMEKATSDEVRGCENCANLDCMESGMNEPCITCQRAGHFYLWTPEVTA